MVLPKRNDLGETLLSKAPHPAFREAIQIWGAGWSSDNLYACIFEHGAQRLRVERITVKDQVSRLFQESIHTIGQIPRDLLHQCFAGLVRASSDVDTPTADVQNEEHVVRATLRRDGGAGSRNRWRA